MIADSSPHLQELHPDLQFYPINRKISITFNAKATVHPQRNNERQQRTTP
ncbi:hypothetical protein [Arthrobacter russicus]|jgi:hypothetical protein|uniref:Uncharacterized protein n=1 Tax=Arthrobacter russicus TaxID=172040 RepID=A0ABU1JF17_9MICC|nr:hypothetical protein [Arthrobacter russicus]MDR6269991.1 hypothetical protein [Arthrobacter russicus]